MRKSDVLLTILQGMCSNPNILRAPEDLENYGERLVMGAESLAAHFRTVMEDYDPHYTFEPEDSEDPDEYEDEDSDEDEDEESEEQKPPPEQDPKHKVKEPK